MTFAAVAEADLHKLAGLGGLGRARIIAVTHNPALLGQLRNSGKELSSFFFMLTER
jgi:hypothetical protein